MSLNLSQKLVLSICSLVLLILTTIMGVGNYVVTKAIMEDSYQELLEAKNIFLDFQQFRFEKLVTNSALVSDIPHLKAVVSTPDIDRATALDSVENIQKIIKSDLFMLTDNQGKLLASFSESERFGDNISMEPAFQSALQGKYYRGFWKTDKEVFQVVANPFIFDNRVVGALLVGYAMDQKMIDELMKMTGFEIVFIWENEVIKAYPEDRKQTPFANLSLAELKRISVFPDIEKRKLELFDQDPQTDDTLIATKTIGNENYMIKVVSMDDKLYGAYFILARSLDYELLFYRKLQNGLLFFGLVLLIITCGIVVILSRKLTQPIGILVEGTKKVAKGDFSARIKIDSKDEIGQLTDSFNRMTENLARSTDKLIFAKNYTDNIIASMIDTLIVIDPQGRIKTVNKATCDLLEYKEEKLIGQNASLLFVEEEIPVKGDRLKKLMEEDSVRDYEMNYRTKNGESIPVSFSSSVLKDKDGNLVGCVGVAKDMRDIKRLIEKEKNLAAAEAAAENERKKSVELLRMQKDLEKRSKELARSNKELEEFAYIASHDLQEPLRKVKTFGDRLKDKYAQELGERGRDYLERMQSAATRMGTLINGLLTYSRVTTKAQPFSEVSLTTVIKEILSDLEVKIEETQARVKVEKLPTIEADPLQIRQLFQNLIGNALKFHKKDNSPVIEIYSVSVESGDTNFNDRHFEKGEICQIRVADNGIGFEEKYCDQIFNAFQRLHGRKEYEGSGIGLAVCRKIVLRHNGTINVESEPGKGTTFIITLPIIQANEKAERKDEKIEN